MPIDYQLKPGENLNDYYLRTQGQTQILAQSQTVPTNYSTIPVTSDNLNPPNDLSKQISYPSISPTIVPTFTDPYALTTEQKGVQDIIEKTLRQQQDLTSEGAFRAEQETAQGIPEATKTLNDLLAQQQVVLNEQAQLQLTKPGTGQGALPTAIIERQYAEKLRQNAVNALGINSLVAAAQGKLATAQSFADRAVKAKFDPIRAQIDSAIANLNLILKSPSYTNAEKKQAQAQLDIQNQKKTDLEEQKNEQENIFKVALEAAKNGVDALTLNNILKAKTSTEAIILAQPALIDKRTQLRGNLDRLLTLQEQEAYGVPAGTKFAEIVGKQPFSPTQRTALNSLQSALPLIDQIQGLVDKLSLAKSTIGSAITGTILASQSLLPSTIAGQYNAQKNAFLSLIVRALGEKGTLATQDIDRIKAALPGFFDTQESAQNKLNNLRTIMNEVYNRSLKGYSEELQSGAKAGNQLDPLGLGL